MLYDNPAIVLTKWWNILKISVELQEKKENRKKKKRKEKEKKEEKQVTVSVIKVLGNIFNKLMKG